MKLIFIWFLSAEMFCDSEGGLYSPRAGVQSRAGHSTAVLYCTARLSRLSEATTPPTHYPNTTTSYYYVLPRYHGTMWLAPIVILLSNAGCPITFQSVIISLWKTPAWPTLVSCYC